MFFPTIIKLLENYPPSDLSGRRGSPREETGIRRMWYVTIPQKGTLHEEFCLRRRRRTHGGCASCRTVCPPGITLVSLGLCETSSVQGHIPSLYSCQVRDPMFFNGCSSDVCDMSSTSVRDVVRSFPPDVRVGTTVKSGVGLCVV